MELGCALVVNGIGVPYVRDFASDRSEVGSDITLSQRRDEGQVPATKRWNLIGRIRSTGCTRTRHPSEFRRGTPESTMLAYAY